MAGIDYLVIGHISSDLTPDGPRIGGTVAYAGKTAHALGCRTAILTSAAVESDFTQALNGIDVHRVPAEATTVFENIYDPAGRRQILHSRAESICADHVPPNGFHAPIVHFAPIADEIEPQMISRFENSLIGLTPQGWMRGWDEQGSVRAREWVHASQYFPSVSAVILSEEDLPDSEAVDRYRKWCRLLVITCGSRGCKVFYKNEEREIPVEPVRESDPTGAGDIFAAAFLIRLYQNREDPWRAARFANNIAAKTVTQIGLNAKIARIQESRETEERK